MRLINKHIDKDGSGSITLYPEEPEDMWHAYNLIRPTDLLRASALRRITTESSTGSTSSHRVQTILTLRVASLDFDSQAGQLHVSGRIAAENKFVRIGAFHTLDLELQRNFTIEKEEGWDSVSLQVVKDAVDPVKKAEAVAVVMQEGMANVCVITEHQTVLRQRVEVGVPRKRQGRAGEHDKVHQSPFCLLPIPPNKVYKDTMRRSDLLTPTSQGLTKFFQTTLDTLLRHLDLTHPKPVLLASPGFTATSFHKYILQHATETSNKSLLAFKSQLLVIHSSSGHIHSLNEVLKSPSVLSLLSNTRYARETQLMDDFMTLLRKDDGRAWYGPKEVERAVEKGAVGRGGGVLLISNRLFRSLDIAERR
ncbi:MAG: Translation factor pelota, partial [Candelina submexicana]